MKTKRFVLVACVLALLAWSVGWTGPAQAQSLTRATSQRVMKSVVQLFAVDIGRTGLAQPKWGGSGTIISTDGLILTNCHVAYPRAMMDDPKYDYDALVVSLTTRSDEPPKATYLAEVMQYDPDLDLAVIRINRTVDGKALDASKLNLPAVSLADSDDMDIGDALFIFGYPGIGGETITLTGGTVSGFTLERGVKGRAWVKTDATIAGGNSGGAGVNDKGELVGVPTRGGAGSTDTIVDCRPIADTNGDGVIDETDTCVPMGGFINALRPVNLAKPLIEAAGRGLGPQPTPETRPTPKVTTGAPKVSNVFFAPEVNSADQPVTVVDSFPSGTERVYVFFDYENLRDGATYHAIETFDGEVFEDAWPVGTWNGGAQGQWWISISGTPLEDGEYEFGLDLDNQEFTLGSVTVGGAEQTRPTLRNIAFSAAGTQGYLFRTGITELQVEFEYLNMTSQARWSYIVYHDGKSLGRTDGKSFLRPSGSGTLTLSNRQGFEAGNYRLELYIGSGLAAVSDWRMAGKQGGGEDLLGPVTFAEGVDKDDKPVRPGTAFKSGIRELYAFFDYHAMLDGWDWQRIWSVDGEVVADKTEAWDWGDSGNYWIRLYQKQGALADGKYDLDLIVQGQQMQHATCSIGKVATRPTPTPTRVAGDEVEVYGRITDADTGWGISGAVFLVLQPGVTLTSFQRTEAEVYAYAEADRNGDYQLSQPLLRGESYSVIIGAEGYQTVSEDNVAVEQDATSPVEINITLQTAG